jgi:diaminopimelate dehydrogenase
MKKIRIGIAGYGNLGRGVELALRQNPDMELKCVLTRRDPASLILKTPGVPVLRMEDAPSLEKEIDVMILCGGSASDLPKQGPQLARLFNTVDSFDTHAKIPQYFDAVDAAAREGGHLSVISAGWDPGLFSLMRLLGGAVLPEGRDDTFWGRGVSQGHSDAIRRIEGVADAKQYTVPVEAAVEAVRAGDAPELTARQKHTRECYVVLKEGADAARVEREIKEMPNYFADYDTTVHFISQQELDRDHAGLPHGGFVIRGGRTGEGGCHSQVIEYSLKLDSNPEFTSSVLAACARAAHKLALENETGARTILDIPPAYLSPLSGAQLRQSLL